MHRSLVKATSLSLLLFVSMVALSIGPRRAQASPFSLRSQVRAELRAAKALRTPGHSRDGEALTHLQKVEPQSFRERFLLRRAYKKISKNAFATDY